MNKKLISKWGNFLQNNDKYVLNIVLLNVFDRNVKNQLAAIGQKCI